MSITFKFHPNRVKLLCTYHIHSNDYTVYHDRLISWWYPGSVDPLSDEEVIWLVHNQYKRFYTNTDIDWNNIHDIFCNINQDRDNIMVKIVSSKKIISPIYILRNIQEQIRTQKRHNIISFDIINREEKQRTYKRNKLFHINLLPNIGVDYFRSLENFQNLALQNVLDEID